MLQWSYIWSGVPARIKYSAGLCVTIYGEAVGRSIIILETVKIKILAYLYYIHASSGPIPNNPGVEDLRDPDP